MLSSNISTMMTTILAQTAQDEIPVNIDEKLKHNIEPKNPNIIAMPA